MSEIIFLLKRIFKLEMDNPLELYYCAGTKLYDKPFEVNNLFV